MEAVGSPGLICQLLVERESLLCQRLCPCIVLVERQMSREAERLGPQARRCLWTDGYSLLQEGPPLAQMPLHAPKLPQRSRQAQGQFIPVFPFLASGFRKPPPEGGSQVVILPL